MVNVKSALKKYWPLVLVVLLGGTLRLYGLLQNPISLYSDEVDMGYHALSLLKTGCDYSGNCIPIQFHSFSDVQPPIPIYLIALAHLLGVPLSLSIRLISAIFGILGIITTYFLVEKLSSKKLFDLDLPHIGLFTSLILALIPWHLTYSRISFSLTLLYFFITTGLYLFTEFLTKRKYIYLYLSVLFLGLSPMVYNTAKMSILFYPFVLLLLPGAYEIFKKNLNIKVAFVSMYIPLAVMFIGGGTTARFDYISIFSDPTASSEINHQRLLDLGPNAQVGSAPSLSTKFFHNKPIWFGSNLVNNMFGLLSTDYLFTKGDPNLRHSPANSGMLYRSLAPALLIGLYFLIRYRQNRLLIVLGLIALTAASTSAITREGANHASRSFMMLLPLIIISGAALSYLYKNLRLVLYFLLGLILIESAFFVHDYWYHYRYSSERSFSAGLKEVVEEAKKHPGQPIVISPKYDPPLMFYLFYTEFDPKRFQGFVKSQTAFTPTHGKNNLEGNRIGDSDFYIATLLDTQNKPSDLLPGAIYFLTRAEFETTGIRSWATSSNIIRLPSGEPLFYEIQF